MTGRFRARNRIILWSFAGSFLGATAFLIVILLISILDKSDATDEKNNGTTQELGQLRVEADFEKILIVEGCEYVTAIKADDGSRFHGLVHRSRCRNPLHHPGMMSNLGFDLDSVFAEDEANETTAESE
ncbi:MAG: hypothetical protein RIR53_879 [Bacteroidota bacterium]|jgi:hypothetical protein